MAKSLMVEKDDKESASVAESAVHMNDSVNEHSVMEEDSPVQVTGVCAPRSRSPQCPLPFPPPAVL